MRSPLPGFTDGHTSVVAIGKDGSATVLDSDTTVGAWLHVTLAGVKNLKQSYGAKIEVKSGAHYQKKTYLGMPWISGCVTTKKPTRFASHGPTG